MIKEKFTVALSQISCKLGDVESNRNKMIEYILKAKDNNANIVIFPELSLTGYYIKDLIYDVAETIPGKSFDIIKEYAIKNNINVVFGMPERLNTHSSIIFNSLVWIKPNGEYTVYRKIYLPTYRIFEEQKYFRNGSKPVYIDTEYGRFGLTICFDIYFPELIRFLSLKDCHTIINISASPSPSRKYFENLILARALENVINVIYVNVAGFQESLSFWGGSFIVNPSGEVLIKCKYYEEDFKIHTIDLSELSSVRKNRPLFKHLNKDIFKLCYDAALEI